MSWVSNGAQWASGSDEPTVTETLQPITRGVRHHRSPVSRRWVTALAITATLSLVTATDGLTTPAAAADDYLLMPRSSLLALPTSGTAWSAMKEEADGSLGSPDLCDQNNDHHLKTLAAALVYARTGSSSYATKARNGVMAAIKTQDVGCGNAVLALGRQLPGYVMAADFAALGGSDDTTFRNWLKVIRSKNIGGHGTRYSLTETHRNSANNWGTHAGAARIAASAYLGDKSDLAVAARILRGFLGDRSAYAGWDFDSTALSWSCNPESSATPISKACTKDGVNLDGAVLEDISRGGSREWPPGGDGVMYQSDAVSSLTIQVQLIARQGYSDAWTWSGSALKRAAQMTNRAGGWNDSNANSQAPWILNVRYGKFLPTVHSPMGRGMGFADWLYGAGANGGGGGGGGGDDDDDDDEGEPPTVTKPAVQLSTTSSVPSSGTPVVVTWALDDSEDGVRRYELQIRRNSGSWTSAKLSSSRATSYRTTLGSTTEYGFRVRAVDNDGRVGPWRNTEQQRGWRVDDGSDYLRWTGPSWSTRSSSSYIAGRAHRATSDDASVSFTFTGSSVAWVSPTKSSYGQGQVFIDGDYVKTVDLRGSSSSRRVVFAKLLSHGRHTIQIRIVGTSGRPTVYVDSLYVVYTD